MENKRAREQMVGEQIIARGIRDERVIAAFERVPRHEFCPPALRPQAYLDGPLPIGEGQTISQPYMVALMSELLNLKKDDRVLELGTGSGYQTAILAELAGEVDTLERISSLSENAQKTLKGLGYQNIDFYVSDDLDCLPDKKNYDAIIVTAAMAQEPKELMKRINDKGRLVVPIGDRLSQMLTKFTKTKDGFIKEEVCRCMFVPYIGEAGFKA